MALKYLSHPVAWQLVNFPLSGLNDPLMFNLLGCKTYKSTDLRHVLVMPGCVRLYTGLKYSAFFMLGTYSGGCGGMSL